MRKPAPRTAKAVLFSDADNTLWDTDAVYAEAQMWLLDQVENLVRADAGTGDRLAFVRRIDQRLAITHHKGLRYPVRLLANALALVLSGVPEERAVRRVWRESATALPIDVAEALEDEVIVRLRRSPHIRAGVSDGLRRLLDLGVCIFVLTEGAADRVRRTLADLELAPLVEQVLEGKKEAPLYRRVLRLKGEPTFAYMVGDQLDRDIAPAKAAGLVTFYFPGGFTPTWTPRETEVGPDFKIHSFSDVADTLEMRLSSPLSRPAHEPRVLRKVAGVRRA